MQPFEFKVDDVPEELWKALSVVEEFFEELRQPPTNADIIRSLSDEELAKLLSNDARACPDRIVRCVDYGNNCESCWLGWLKQPAEGD